LLAGLFTIFMPSRSASLTDPPIERQLPTSRSDLTSPAPRLKSGT